MLEAIHFWVASTARWRFIGVSLALLCAVLLPTPGRADVADSYFKAVMLDNGYEVGQLLKQGVSPNLTEPKRGDSGLILALREESMQVFEVLLNAPGVDLEVRARNGDTALMIAAWKENRRAVEALLKKGAKVDQPGWTALHYAAAKGNDAIVQLLLDKSADVNAQSPPGITPLMMAAQGGHIYTVKLLLDAGADITQEDANGRTAITFAQHGGYEDIVTGLTYQLGKMEKGMTSQATKAPPPLLFPVRLPPME